MKTGCDRMLCMAEAAELVDELKAHVITLITCVDVS